MTDRESETEPPVALPVSPNTGLDSEIRQFMGRIMVGYEAAHRTIADMSEANNKSVAELHKAVTTAIQLQMKAATEREELISKRHKRDLEMVEAAQQQETRATLLKDVRSILLLAGKKYLGVPLSGNDSHGLQDLLTTMTPEQIENVVATGQLQLTPAQQQLLAATIMSIAETKELEAKKPEAAE